MFPTFKIIYAALRRWHIADFALLLVCGILTGAICGGIANAINGKVCPEYFEYIFVRWPLKDVYFNSIKEGIFEGMWVGIIISPIFTLFVLIVSKASCRFTRSWTYLLKIAAIDLACWFTAGMAGVVGARMFPNFYSIVREIGGNDMDRYRLLWVGFSIWGTLYGGIVALIFGCIWFWRDWKTKPALRYKV